ncbi:hypothetical protein SCFA_1270004 [anaerobic digester metagenome]|uniref:Uncharacterized protein n=1 Tax=anaerobic digester metagenome TaxID=1263854 RepID=A0A485LV63_9ZZZZ
MPVVISEREMTHRTWETALPGVREKEILCCIVGRPHDAPVQGKGEKRHEDTGALEGNYN